MEASATIEMIHTMGGMCWANGGLSCREAEAPSIFSVWRPTSESKFEDCNWPLRASVNTVRREISIKN